jgi:hypothetical protein
MGSNNSPLESLAAFAIVFVVGVLFTAGVGKYVEKIKKDAASSVQPNSKGVSPNDTHLP